MASLKLFGFAGRLLFPNTEPAENPIQQVVGKNRSGQLADFGQGAAKLDGHEFQFLTLHRILGPDEMLQRFLKVVNATCGVGGCLCRPGLTCMFQKISPERLESDAGKSTGRKMARRPGAQIALGLNMCLLKRRSPTEMQITTIRFR